MEALLIPLAKGLLSLLGASSVLFFKVRQDVEIQVQRAQEAQEDAELRLLEAQEELNNLPPKIQRKELPPKK